MNHPVEIRTLNLKPGTRAEFHRLYIEKALPLLQRWNFDVVAHAPSLHDENTYYVIRRYDSLAQREQMEDAYYASDDWRHGPRETMLTLIESIPILSLRWMRSLCRVAQKGLMQVGRDNPSWLREITYSLHGRLTSRDYD